MWKTFWIGGTIAVVLLGAVVWAAGSSTFLFRHPRAPDIRIVIDKQTGAPIVEALADPTKSAKLGATEPEPRVVVKSNEHDFGYMNPDTKGHYAFEVKNIGAGPLKLKLGPTTCKCTLSGLSKDVVLPGETAAVNLEWDTGRKQLVFEQTAVVLTNDPLHDEIELKVTGRVRMEIAVEPKDVVLSAIVPDAATGFEVLAYSQLWDDFQIQNLHTLLKDVKWEVEPVDPALFPKLDARSVKKIKVQFPGPVVQGKFSDLMRLDIQPIGAEDDKPQPVDLPVSGSVLRRLAIYGPAINEAGLIDLGTLREGAGKKAKLVVKIRDSETDLGTPKLNVQPAFLKANLQPHPGEKGTGLYDLTVEVPEGTPPCQYRTSPLGRLEIVTDHPRIGTVELSVSFAVLPR